MSVEYSQDGEEKGELETSGIMPRFRFRFGRSAVTSYLDQAVHGQSMSEKANAKSDWRRAARR